MNKVTTFATLGAVATSNHLISNVLPEIPGGSLSTISEETLALLAVVTTRALEFGLSGQEDTEAILVASAEIPFLYRDYVIGRALLDDELEETEAELMESYESVSRRLEFYFSHFAAGAFPGRSILKDKLLLWMGRISVPGLETSPAQRLETSGAIEEVLAHAKLVLGFVRQQG